MDMEENGKLDGTQTEGYPIGQFVFKSKWNSLGSFEKRLKSLPFKNAQGIDLSTLRNALFDYFMKEIKKIVLEWEKDYERMNVVTEYEKGKKEGCLELIQKRILE